jgi:hypothetical protein
MDEKSCISYLSGCGELISLATLEERLEDIYGKLAGEAWAIERVISGQERRAISDHTADQLISAMEAMSEAATVINEYCPAASMTYCEMIEADGPRLVEDGLKITDSKSWFLGALKTLHAMKIFCGDEGILKAAAESSRNLSEISGLLKAIRTEVDILLNGMELIASKSPQGQMVEQDQDLACLGGVGDVKADALDSPEAFHCNDDSLCRPDTPIQYVPMAGEEPNSAVGINEMPFDAKMTYVSLYSVSKCIDESIPILCTPDFSFDDILTLARASDRMRSAADRLSKFIESMNSSYRDIPLHKSGI